MRRTSRTLLFALLAAWLVVPAAAAEAEPRIAAPAAPRVVASCSAQAEANAPTAHVEQVVRGVGELHGCIADTSGIAHMFLAWTSADGRSHGRICVDPAVRDGAWTCAWDTTALEPGSYLVEMTAIDPVGNRGSFEQAYRVEAAPAEPAPTEPAPAEPAPAEPAPSAPALPEPAPIPSTPTVAIPLAQLVAARVDECAQLELAPGVVADRALSIAVLDCMTPALEVLGSSRIDLDEIPVPPSIRLAFGDVDALAAADELLPDSVGGVGLELVLEPVDSAAA
jgi:hypothetical protein